MTLATTPNLEPLYAPEPPRTPVNLIVFPAPELRDVWAALGVAR